MEGIVISKEFARQFAYDCYDIIIQEIREQSATKSENNEKA